MTIGPNKVTALIGSSGCGKTTFLRSINRMHELTPGARVEGEITIDGEDIYDPRVDPVQVRRLVGMVFQQPNPFPTMSIYENVAAGLNLNSSKMSKSEKDEVVERSLRGAHLWDEVKDRLDKPGSGLSGGQQQRLCIARAIAVEPEVLLMDEPCSALDPVATLAIEDLIKELKEQLHDRDRHPQHAAGEPRQRLHGLLQPREERRPGAPGRDRRDDEDLLQPDQEGHRGLRQRAVRLSPRHAARATRRSSRSSRSAALGGLDLVVETLNRTLEAVEHSDIELAEMVIADDDRIDGRYLEVHQSILTLLATQAPVATDLRLIAALLHVMKSIERMGDQCVNIAKVIPLTGHEPPRDEQMIRDIMTMGKQVRSLISQSKQAFADPRRRALP